MEQNKAQSLMESTKKELTAIRTSASRRNEKTPKLPLHIWDNISKLKDHYSRSEILSNLSLSSSQYAKAKSSVGPLKVMKNKHNFIDISSSIPSPPLRQLGEVEVKKIILEIKTKNGNTISVYE